MSGHGSSVAEIAHAQLRSCLVNLPPSLVEAIVNAGTNIIVELQAHTQAVSRQSSAVPPQQQSVFVGWTGISSRRRSSLPSTVHNSSKASSGTNYVEIDPAFARVLELSEGQKVSITLRTDPQLVHTLNVEPLTSGDWEMIELHADFLETNLQTQVRALPNPNFAGTSNLRVFAHPLALHLSPTSTANIVVTSLTPEIASNIPCAKLAPDAEVIVAPKSRTRAVKHSRAENRSVTGLSQRSTGTRSAAGSVRGRNPKPDHSRLSLFLRAINSSLIPHLDLHKVDSGRPTIWVAESHIKKKFPKIGDWITVSTVSSPNTSNGMPTDDLHGSLTRDSGDGSRQSTRIVARLKKAETSFKAEHAIISPALAAMLGIRRNAGVIVRVEQPPAATPIGKIKTLNVAPFDAGPLSSTKSLRIGADSRADKETAAHEIRQLFGSKAGSGLLSGALTDGMILSEQLHREDAWKGGLLKFDPRPVSSSGRQPSAPHWTVDDNESLPIEIVDEVSKPHDASSKTKVLDDTLPAASNRLVGFEGTANKVIQSILHRSSVLLEGSMGAGKTSLASIVAERLESEHFFHSTYVDCRKLASEETRLSTIKESLRAIFMQAWWGSQLGGRSVVVLDGLDKLCPAETELQVGGENARSRQLSEILAAMVHQHCAATSGVTLLATANDKESLQSMLMGSHVMRDIVSIRAPDKPQRRDILETLLKSQKSAVPARQDRTTLKSYINGENSDEALDDEERAVEVTALAISQDIDFLDIAGRTDGYMPGDLVLLASRTRSAAIIRTIQANDDDQNILVTRKDFSTALKGFKPVSLRNVTLQASSTTFDSIGGLETTRKILLETLQYPTTYAPIFARCPLRLRSGLLLYGYPGCGKTLLASAVAGECGLNFISVKGPEILNKYIGASEKSVRDLFERAESAKPCVLFFDEFDSIAPKRGHDSTGVTDRVVNQLLTQMDGAEGLSGVYVLAATSRPDLIDPALLRPGRLDKSLLCDMPDELDRHGILCALSKHLKISANIDRGKSNTTKSFAEIARRTGGYSGADLQAVMYNAHLEAVHEALAEHKPGTVSAKSTGPKSKSLQRQELLTFRFGDPGKMPNGTEASSAPQAKSPQPVERVALLEQLEKLRLAKRKERAVRHGQHNESHKTAYQHETPEPVIQWKHVEASLASTRKSINDVERTKLARIYREFIVGRNGEMPSGQASTEVGARSSLM